LLTYLDVLDPGRTSTMYDRSCTAHSKSAA
jgi:hypothetical protein